MSTEDGRMEFSTADQIDRLPGRVDALEAITAALPTTYQPLTAAAKQDAALVDLINSGPKNVANADANSQTFNQVTFTRVGDGTWTTSGTASERAAKMLPFTVPASLKAGRYVLAGCPPGGKVGTTIKYCLYLMDITAGVRVTPGNDDTGDGFRFDWTPNSDHQYAIMIDIRSGTNASGLTFFPMVCSEAAYNATPTPVKYVPSNAELYAMIQSL